ncbi:Recombinase [Butyrivibrio proteoclasticus]|uniref:Recombinase n=1 Tax=Butyrivibrio proteoclasticus TaxID=43305 RepID=A0A1I5TPU8_9FIRM|nr:recombinase zinc beta ribbon domain-containing protein [Butyrivibrio proteoclasticus]SFP84637.1 Recombinase [Butyrivibrio proteoclasticus]
MPRRALHPCQHPGCPNICEGRYCDAHKMMHPNNDRMNAAERGYGSKWQKARKRFLDRPENFFCLECKKEGVFTRAINKGQVNQYYVEGNHEAIIDTETWEAVQEELKRREDFMRDHNSKRYNYGSDPNPFSGRVFCGECGSRYGRYTWPGRGIHQWQCCNHRVEGKLICRNAFVDQKNLERGFVLAYNEFITDKSRFEGWKKENRSPLKHLRARQLLELSKQEPLTGMVEELAELVVWEVIILGKKEYEFTFMDGSKVKATVE